MVSLDKVADLASITTQEELQNDEEFLKPLDRKKEEYSFWEQQIDAVLYLLRKKGLINLHILRKNIESIDKSIYNKISYYERWAISIAKHCLESGLLTQEDLNKRYGQPLSSTDEQLFQVGDQVQVQHENYATRWIKPHLRTPGYLYGKIGTIERYVGSFPNPEYFAYGNTETTGHLQPLYRVRFNQKTIWGCYPGADDDTIDVEIYQHWIKPVAISDAQVKNNEEKHPNHDNLSHRHNDHDHDHDHVHQDRATIEQNAIDREGSPLPCQHLAESLVDALIDKDLISSKELTQQIENNQMSGIEQRGANVIVEAWLNTDFKEQLLKDGTKTIAKFLNIDQMTNDIAVLENTDEIHNLIVCTLCSCYPRQLLGIPPGWYKSRSYRVRAVRDPRSVLKEFGTILPDDMKIQVHDSTADLRYIVIPRRPQKTLNWSRQQLIDIVTRDAMIGVSDIIV